MSKRLEEEFTAEQVRKMLWLRDNGYELSAIAERFFEGNAMAAKMYLHARRKQVRKLQPVVTDWAERFEAFSRQ